MSRPYQKGLEEISRIDPEYGPAFVKELEQLSPDFADYFVEFAFGRVYARSALEPKCKELLAIAYLTALGHGSAHLKLHISGALHAGCSREQITEVVIQSVIYVGFMRALAALHLVKEVFDDASACNAGLAPKEEPQTSTAKSNGGAKS
jgi:4-carboxymuconolactone decarboxylase